MRKLLTFLCAALMSVGMFALTPSGTDTWDEGTKTLTVNSNPGDWGDYYYESEIVHVVISDAVTSIGESAFSECTGLTSIEIPNSVTSIGNTAFAGCSGLTSITIPSSVTSIGQSAFSGCTGLTSITIPNSVTSIENAAFEDCSGLTSIEIPNSVTSIRSYAFAGCSGLTSVTIPNSVTSIGYAAFRDCSGLTSIEIPNSVTSIEPYAFYNCSGLTSVTIPNSVIGIGEQAFKGCTGLTSVTIGNSVKIIDGFVFEDCSGLTSVIWNAKNCVAFIGYFGSQVTSFTFGNEVESIPAFCCAGMNQLTSITIPNSVMGIGENAFSGCSGLSSVDILSETPSILGVDVFDPYLSSIYVPCGTLDAYKQSWSNYADKIKYHPLKYTITGNVNIAAAGNVTLPSTICDDDISAVPNYGYHFVQWNDGSIDNPRTIVLTQDTTFTAEFAVDKSGNCGDNNALTWEYDAEIKTLTIKGEGDLCSNYTFGVEAPNEMKNLIISEGVTAIGNSAFANQRTLRHISIAASVKTIYEQAFYNCTGMEQIYCYREKPSVAYSNTFDGIDKFECILHVLAASVDMYKAATGWREFYYIETIDAETITEEVEEVVVTPTETTANIIWPIVQFAASYEIIIRDLFGNVIFRLVFNAQGQLTGISFAPSRGKQQEQVEGFNFTITGLSSGTSYAYSIVAKDSEDNELDTKLGTFQTISDVTTGNDDIFQSSNPQILKFVRDGVLYIFRDGVMYSTQGARVQ